VEAAMLVVIIAFVIINIATTLVADYFQTEGINKVIEAIKDLDERLRKLERKE
jgi:hypothetical protein